MRAITVKYANDCVSCGKHIEAGEQAVYERRVGLFCPGCEPTGTEEIRAYRQAGADRKADRLDEWASKRETKAAAQLSSLPSIRNDWAFITQPGHVPLRAKMNKADGRAYESLGVARKMRSRAASLRTVRVKGDAERKRQELRDFIRARLVVGMTVETAFFGTGIVKRINKKTARVLCGDYSSNVDLSFVVLPQKDGA